MFDTIVAIATPPGIGALSIIRLSGKESIDIVNSFFSKNILQVESHTAHFGKILDEDKSTIDEVVLLIMKGKTSFTGENSVEIICHGNPLIAQKIVRRALSCGARVAMGGEFSQRAFSNGKLDLLQAEAIKEMIHAKSERSLKEASLQLGGSLSLYVKDLQTRFIDLLAIVEVHIDYPEEGIEPTAQKELISLIQEAQEKIRSVTSTFHDGKKLFSGQTVAIIGAPNAGKSSLLNALLDEDRSIVSTIAGTTRDTIEEELTIDGYIFKFIDTAGIHEAFDPLEKMGISRSLKAVEHCDIPILLIDLSAPISEDIHTLYLTLKNPLVVYNKEDLSEKINPLNVNNPIYISAKHKTGLKILKQALIGTLSLESNQDVPILTKERHFIKLNEALTSLEKALSGLFSHVSIDLISFELRMGLFSLSEIIGINITEEILGGIFSKFCVGK
jgi:tRNA modification GTPase